MQNQFLGLCADVHKVSIEVAREIIKREVIVDLWKRMKANGSTWKELFDAKEDLIEDCLQNVYDCGCYFVRLQRIDFIYLLDK